MSLPLLLLVMSLATYRLTRFVVEDDFPPMLWLRYKLAGGWRPLDEVDTAVYKRLKAQGHDTGWNVEKIDGVPHEYVRRARRVPQWIADLISCPWCASGWIALVVTAGTWATVGLPVPLLVWPAVWGAGALIAAQEWA